MTPISKAATLVLYLTVTETIENIKNNINEVESIKGQ